MNLVAAAPDFQWIRELEWVRSAKVAAAVALSVGCLTATSATTSFQDIPTLTGSKVSDENRWLSHLVKVPVASSHTRVATFDVSNKAIQSSASFERVFALKTGNVVKPLNPAFAKNAGQQQKVVKVTKSDRLPGRIEQPRLASESALLQNTLLSSLEKAHDAGPDGTRNYNMRLANFAAKDRRMAEVSGMKPVETIDPVVTSSIAPDVAEKPQNNAMDEKAAAAARALKLAVKKHKKTGSKAKEVLVTRNKQVRGTLSAYAPPEPAPTGRNDPFNLVLKQDDAKVATVPVPTRRPVSDDRAVITLAKGDHSWVMKPLPRRVSTKRERRCLAAGVYFEARGEPVRGQEAVAQVILNRVKNPAFPGSICGVVYQNKRWRNRCQFSFACDGIRDRIRSGRHWRIAKKVANKVIEGKVWIASIGSSTHYHADYVRPRWARGFTRMKKIGRHIFYRTIRGGWT